VVRAVAKLDELGHAGFAREPSCYLESQLIVAAAVVLAFIIWFSVYLQIQETIIIRELPIQMKTSNKLAIIDAEDIPRFTVTVRGPKRVLNTLTANNIRIHYTVPEDTPIGPYQVRLNDAHVDLPGRAEVIAIEPGEFTVTLDNLTDQMRNVRPIFEGDAPAGWVVKNLTVTPSQVKVVGPAGMIVGISEITTLPIKLTENTPANFYAEISLVSYPGVELEPGRVVVSVEYTRTDGQRAFGQLPIMFSGAAGSDLYVASISGDANPLATATVSGPHAVLDTLTPSSLHVFVSLAGETRTGTVKLPVGVYIREASCKAVNVNPAWLEVTLARRPAGEDPRGIGPPKPEPTDAAPPTDPTEPAEPQP
jgi:YbbR domain-containing protein